MFWLDCKDLRRPVKMRIHEVAYCSCTYVIITEYGKIKSIAHGSHEWCRDIVDIAYLKISSDLRVQDCEVYRFSEPQQPST